MSFFKNVMATSVDGAIQQSMWAGSMMDRASSHDYECWNASSLASQVHIGLLFVKKFPLP